MKKEYFTTPRDILNTLPELRGAEVRLYDNLKNEDLIRDFPFIMLEPAAMDYQNIANKTQECKEGQIIVHLFYKIIDENDTYLFDLSQKVYTLMAVNQYKRLNEVPNYLGDGIMDWQIKFESPVIVDTDAKTTYYVHTKPPLTIELD